MTYKTKADKAFDEKLEQLLHPPFIISMSISEFAQARREPIDWTAVERLFTQYGSYLDLIAEHEFGNLEHFSYEFIWVYLDHEDDEDEVDEMNAQIVDMIEANKELTFDEIPF